MVALPEYSKDLRSLEDTKRGEKWARRALEAEAAIVAGAMNGTRNTTLNNAAFKLGRKVGAGYLQAAEVEAALMEAAQRSGLAQEDGPEAVRATIRSGLEAGKAEPEHPQDRHDHRPAPRGPTIIQPAPARDLDMVPFDDDAPNLDDANLIEGVIPDEGLGAMFGKPGCGKTFVALDLAFAIAGAADEWRDKYVEHGAVMYFGMEGGRKFANRIHAYKMERGRAPYFYRSNANLNLRSNQQDAEAVIAEAKKIAAFGVPVRMIVVDTLSRALAGGNENGPEDMGAFVAICEHIRKAVGCFLLVVHHSGKDEARGMRGHTSLLGAVDTELELKAGDGGRLMTVTKQRDGEDGEQFGYMLRSVLIGSSTTRGKPITSCVVEPTEAKSAAPRLGSAQRVALEALRQFIEDEGKACPSGTGWPEAGSRRIVEIADFLQFLSDKLTNDKADDRRRSAKRCFDALIEKGLVQTNEGSAWIV